MTRQSVGTLRQRRPSAWEIRVHLVTDPVSGRPVQRSVTVQGELAEAEDRRAMLAAQADQLRAARQQPVPTVGALLASWLAADHDWKPSTRQGYRIAVRRLATDSLARRPPTRVSPPVLRAAMSAWTAAGVPTSTIALHVRTLKAAFGWAYEQRLIAAHPLEGMRGPGQPEPRRDVPVAVVRSLLQAAERDVVFAADPGRRDGLRQRHLAEQVALLVRLAAYTGARRGELAALRLDDLHGRVLHLDRGVSAEIVTSTKTGRTRRVTVGARTAAQWQDTVAGWCSRLTDDTDLGPWLFSAHRDHHERLACSTLGHWFAAFVRRHGHDDVCRHRLWHTVATVLVANCQLLQAQQRLRHRDASTTLRQYCHALPLNDQDVADSLEAVYDDPHN